MKTHFLVSESPQNFDGTVKALCGAEINRAVPVDTWEGKDNEVPAFNPLRDCSECIERAPLAIMLTGENWGQTVYVYSIVPGEESLRRGSQEAKNAQAGAA